MNINTEYDKIYTPQRPWMVIVEYKKEVWQRIDICEIVTYVTILTQHMMHCAPYRYNAYVV